MIYFDTSYLARLYLEDRGWREVRELAATDNIACCIHGRAEVVSAFHRKFREGHFNQIGLNDVIAEFDRDCDSGAFRWLPLSATVIARLTRIYAELPRGEPLRAADALHLAAAAENAFKEIYSNDVKLLSAASHFQLRGVNVIPSLT